MDVFSIEETGVGCQVESGLQVICKQADFFDNWIVGGNQREETGLNTVRVIYLPEEKKVLKVV